MDIPQTYKSFQENYPEIASAYENLGDAVHNNGPLDNTTRALIKLGIAIGAKMEGAVHSHTRKALEAGLTPEEIRHVVLLSLPTIGFPTMMASMTWVEDILRDL